MNCVVFCCYGFVAFRRFIFFLPFLFSLSPRFVDSAFLWFVSFFDVVFDSIILFLCLSVSVCAYLFDVFMLLFSFCVSAFCLCSVF